MSSHLAAVLPAPRARLDVRSIETPTPARDEVLVRVHAVAINPVDWVVQGTSRVTYRWLRTPRSSAPTWRAKSSPSAPT